MNARILAYAFLILSLPAAAAERKLEQLTMPDGFRISVFAEVENARQMAQGDSGILYVGSRRAGKLHAVIDEDGDHKADRVVLIDDELNMPSGITYRDGDLYVAAVSTIYRYRDIDENFNSSPEPEVITDAFPTDRHHGWKFIDFGPDGNLYVPVGAPCNICDREEPYATIVKMDVDNPDGWEIVARGVRNSVGFDWDPATGDLWFTDNGRDHMGDDIPPCELNHLSEEGQHFGYPYFHGASIVDPEFGDKGETADAYREPALNLGPHTAPLGMMFYTGDMLPESFRGNILLAERGSWNRTPEAGHIGYRLVHARKNDAGELQYDILVEGWLNDDKMTNWGRPVDLLQLDDGSILISDDGNGTIYRLSYDDDQVAASD